MLAFVTIMGNRFVSLAGERVVKKSYKVKRASSHSKEARNTFSKYKQYNGYKIKRKIRNK